MVITAYETANVTPALINLHMCYIDSDTNKPIVQNVDWSNVLRLCLKEATYCELTTKLRLPMK